MQLRLLIDENVRREVADFLKENHNIKILAAGTKDEVMAAVAAKEKRILITHDLDFANIFLYPPTKYAGIVVLRILPPLVATIKRALINLFATLTTEQYNGKLIILEPDGFRIWEE